jgi:hypothetical protein
MHLPSRNNEISGLMIMGVSGGAIVLSLCIIYLILLTTIISERKQ